MTTRYLAMCLHGYTGTGRPCMWSEPSTVALAVIQAAAEHHASTDHHVEVLKVQTSRSRDASCVVIASWSGPSESEWVVDTGSFANAARRGEPMGYH